MNRRTTLITAAAIAGTVLAGGTAVAANIGILNSADSSPIGDLNATADLAPAPTPEPQVVDVFIDDPTPSTVVTPTTIVDSSTTAQEFAVDDAGTVTVERTESGLRLGAVEALTGWEWESTQDSETELVVTFSSGDSTYVFFAEVADDGAISARVDQPIVQTVQVAASSGSSPVATAPPAAGGTGGYDDDHDEDEDDEDEDDHEEEHDDDHENDEDEHEGGDDDD